MREATNVTIVLEDQKDRRKMKSGQEKKCADDIPPREVRSVDSIKEGDLDKPKLVRGGGSVEGKNEPRESGGRTGSRESTRLRREGQRKRGREWGEKDERERITRSA